MTLNRGPLDDDCPKRGPGLKHIQDGRRKPSGACVYCDTKLPMLPPPWAENPDGTLSPPSVTPPVPFDVTTRLRALGLVPRDQIGVVPSDEPSEEDHICPAELAHECSKTASHLSGNGPSGPKWGAGRGELTERFKKKLDFIRFMADRVLP